MSKRKVIDQQQAIFDQWWMARDEAHERINPFECCLAKIISKIIKMSIILA
ncbi:hypothetical protein [Pedobacter gandavensis]|uniref:hypothetical protein n=1 Tax=Pedobacter gandavensis TaxID=2679963 RepID=UPI00292E4DAB|nr:hypothetical protein [Pedobacter gandavensis]